jgi:hypothetical protein
MRYGNETRSGALRTGAFLRFTERWAVRMRRHLRAIRAKGAFAEHSEIIDGAVKRIQLVERLAIRGQVATAREAVKIAEIVDLLVDSLGPDIHLIQAS